MLSDPAALLTAISPEDTPPILCKGLLAPVLFVTAQYWNQPKCPSRRWLNKLCYIHPKECYKKVNMSEEDLCDLMWRDFSDTLFRKKSKVQGIPVIPSKKGKNIL